MSALKIKNITKIFGSQPNKAIELLNNGASKDEIMKKTNSTIAVNDVSFDVHDGEIFVIMGLSGSGKSTLLRMLNRIITPTAGSIFVDDENIVQYSENQLRHLRRKKMGMVFQHFALFPHLTVLENVRFGLNIQGLSRAESLQKAHDALKLVGLIDWQTSYPDQLSGGMQQRIGIARALASDPDILLMDEAFSALDPLVRKEMQDELLELQEKMQKTIIFITHDLNEALKIGDRIALMKDGVIIQIGTPEEIMAKPADHYVEKFVEDVDLSKVLTVDRIMKRPETITPDKGPRVAFQLMKENGVSTLYVVDKKKELLGLLTTENVTEALVQNKSLEEVMMTSVATVASNTLLHDLFKVLAFSHTPIAVTDKNRKLLGIVVKGAVFGGLAGKFNSSDEKQKDIYLKEDTNGRFVS